MRKYDAKKFMELLESFSGLVVEHLKAEVDMLVELEKYSIDWEPINARTVKHAVETAEKLRGPSLSFAMLEYGADGRCGWYQEIPFILHNMDITFENNLHVGVWPALPWIAQLIFCWFYVPKYKGAWRFGSCDAYGRPKELEFVPAN